MTFTLITGANKGVGRETARRLIEAGHTVLMGARDAERGRRAASQLGAVAGTLAWQGRLDEAAAALARADVTIRPDAEAVAALAMQYIGGQLLLAQGRAADALAIFQTAGRLAAPHAFTRPVRAAGSHADAAGRDRAGGEVPGRARRTARWGLDGHEIGWGMLGSAVDGYSAAIVTRLPDRRGEYPREPHLRASDQFPGPGDADEKADHHENGDRIHRT
jgi:NAD(P)-dependent dehydrogenase (short-subunit alcohol dehydrogenase family)